MAFDKKRYGKKLDLLPKKIPTERISAGPFKSVQEILEDRVDAHYYMSSRYLETLKRHKISQKSKGHRVLCFWQAYDVLLYVLEIAAV